MQAWFPSRVKVGFTGFIRDGGRECGMQIAGEWQSNIDRLSVFLRWTGLCQQKIWRIFVPVLDTVQHEIIRFMVRLQNIIKRPKKS
ncbi:MAG: hypothetical protein D6690_04945 [Nitrospirae bacterium]|nr:MAG: hypothetical protein D6690_04945 [Nitrospirota bacterium]